MKTTFAGHVRAAAKALQAQKRHVTLEALEMGCGQLIRTRRDRDWLCKTVSNLCAAGEMRREAAGIYLYLGRQAPAQKQQIMWRYLRSSRSFGGVTVDELVEVAGAAPEYVKEWLGVLMVHQVVKETNGRWCLTSDQVQMPRNEAKAQRLRNIRSRKSYG
jgi:hypothetical protein